ncbi:MAG: hypothetical protein LBV49_05440 [Azonexus sp.]|jgi:hypothetical protein|nr:hypothetical protein [Azonexus sp.]
MITRHPSSTLNCAFSEKPFQGQHPEEARFLFIGQDANYDHAIEKSSIFKDVLEYHADGVGFWKKHGVHHPFLLPGYTGDGRKYHKNFARIGFAPDLAEHVSFVELLHFPTVGRNNLDIADLSAEHLSFLNEVIFYGKAQYVFIPRVVATLMHKSGAFSWMPQQPKRMPEQLDTWFSSNKVTIFAHLHFSVYGKFEAKKAMEISRINKIVEHFRQQL